MGYNDVFGGTNIYPADVTYLAIALTGDVQLDWPMESAAPPYPLARIIDVIANGPHVLRLPNALEGSPGYVVLFNLLSASSSECFVVDFEGTAVATLGVGEQWEIYLTDNTTQAGEWEVFHFGASTATVQPSALAGYGMTVTGSTLSQSVPVTTFNASPRTVLDSDRASAMVWTGSGSGVLNLPGVAAVGNNYFVSARNAGGGMLTLDPLGGEIIDGGTSVALTPGEGVVLVTDGLVWYSLGRGQAAVFAFDYTVIDLSASGPTYTLTGSELNRIAYKFTGALTTNVTVIVPSTVQQYWIDNQTTGAFGLSLSTLGGVPIGVPQGSRGIYYCDGINVVDADTGGISTPINASDGGTGHSSYTIGDLLVASGPTTLSRLAAPPAGNALLGQGVGVVPAWGPIPGTALGGFVENAVTKGGPAPGGTLMSSPALFEVSGKVGVNVTAPAASMHVKGDYETQRWETTVASGAGSNLQTWYDATGRKGFMGYPATNVDSFTITNERASFMTFGTGTLHNWVINSTEFMRLTPNGLGIGYNNPQSALHVAGDARFALPGDAATYNLRIHPFTIAAGVVGYDFRTLDATYGDRSIFTATPYGELSLGGLGTSPAGSSVLTINSQAGTQGVLNFSEAGVGKASTFWHPASNAIFRDADVHNFRSHGGVAYMALTPGLTTLSTNFNISGKVVITDTASLLGLSTTTARGSGQCYMAFNDPTARKGYIGYVADERLFITNEEPNAIILQSNGLNTLVVDPNSKVGINTLAPEAALHVRDIVTVGPPVGTGGSGGITLRGTGGLQTGIQFWTDGSIAGNLFYHPPSVTMYMDADVMLWRTSAGVGTISVNVASFRPAGDGNMLLGVPSARWGQIYSTITTISISDAREKDWLGGLSPEELAAAKAIAAGIGTYRWLDTTLSDKVHVGVTAQAVIEAMEAQGLDALAYGFVRYDEWEETPEVPSTPAVAETRSEDGEIETPAVPAFTGTPGTPAGNRYSVSYEELAMFIAAAQEQRLAALEALL